ncbi:MAG: hypothetical protein HUK06_08380 [Bacteroidaceae bacterium]|nr:hypothetical protein [Bacteroidaceae bacterium]
MQNSKCSSSNSHPTKQCVYMNDIRLKKLSSDFVYDFMSIPTYSEKEKKAIEFIANWAKLNNIDCERDYMGNVYLTKGSVSDGEYFPCVTAHLDTVQCSQIPYIERNQRLDVKTRVNDFNEHEIYCEGFGIGGDDKAGIVVCLSMFEQFDKLKAAFFVQEEIGCQGSRCMNMSWFSNVGYVIGYDSPELNRASKSCYGVELFDDTFFHKHLKSTVEKWGITNFRHEPYTDVTFIRNKTGLVCMNFGVGYYNCHGNSEYCVLEHMDQACAMGIDIINHLGNNQYT